MVARYNGECIKIIKRSKALSEEEKKQAVGRVTGWLLADKMPEVARKARLWDSMAYKTTIDQYWCAALCKKIEGTECRNCIYSKECHPESETS